MGLDITVYSELKKVHGNRSDARVYLYNLPSFKARNTKFPKGHYSAEPIFSAHNFYGKYGQFRSLLAQLIGAKDQEEVWNNPETYSAKPFYELINFADNEGTIDYEVAERIAKAFEEFEAKALSEFDEYNLGKYQDWQKAFRLAADNKGVVKYH